MNARWHWQGIALWVAISLGALAAASCAATYALQNEFVFPNDAEGPMGALPPGAILKSAM